MYNLNRKYKLFLLLVKDTSSKYYWQKYRLHALQKKLSSSSHIIRAITESNVDRKSKLRSVAGNFHEVFLIVLVKSKVDGHA